MLYKFRGFHGCLSECDLDIVRSSSKTTLVICTELPDNPGTSVTNLAAELATNTRPSTRPLYCGLSTTHPKPCAGASSPNLGRG